LKTVWIDFLCLPSAMRFIWIWLRQPVKKAYYLDSSLFFGRLIALLEKMTKCSVEHMNYIPEGEAKIGDITLYELIQRTLIDVSIKWLNERNIADTVKRYCGKYGYSQEKFGEHLKAGVYPHLLKPIEAMVLSQKTINTSDSQ